MIIDAHIHLDGYSQADQEDMIHSFKENKIRGVVAVSKHLHSCREVLRLHRKAPDVIFPAFGFHPEQPLMTPSEEVALFDWIRKYEREMIAIGEVGLPYYSRKEAQLKGEHFTLKPYINLLEKFIILAKELERPIVLHAVYEDAEIACDLLNKHGVKQALFHWFKGAPGTLARLQDHRYMISVTPEVWHREKIRHIVRHYPLDLLMVETDGPWPFTEEVTVPAMIHQSIKHIAILKDLPEQEVRRTLYDNTVRFFNLPLKQIDYPPRETFPR